MVALNEPASGLGPSDGEVVGGDGPVVGDTGVVAGAPGRLPLPALLALATRVVTESVHRGLAEQGFADIRPAHGYAFSLIAMRGGATGVEIAAHLGMTKQSAKVLIDQLENAGYVTRERTDRDRRTRVVQLTDRGWAGIEAGTRLWAESESDLREVMGDHALETARQVLGHLVGRHISPDEATPLRPPR